jgi:hypothetical protein
MLGSSESSPDVSQDDIGPFIRTIEALTPYELSDPALIKVLVKNFRSPVAFLILGNEARRRFWTTTTTLRGEGLLMVEERADLCPAIRTFNAIPSSTIRTVLTAAGKQDELKGVSAEAIALGWGTDLHLHEYRDQALGAEYYEQFTPDQVGLQLCLACSLAVRFNLPLITDNARQQYYLMLFLEELHSGLVSQPRIRGSFRDVFVLRLPVPNCDSDSDLQSARHALRESLSIFRGELIELQNDIRNRSWDDIVTHGFRNRIENLTKAVAAVERVVLQQHGAKAKQDSLSYAILEIKISPLLSELYGRGQQCAEPCYFLRLEKPAQSA